MEYSLEDVVRKVNKGAMSKAQGARVLDMPVSTFKDKLERLQNGNGLGPVFDDDGLAGEVTPYEIPIFNIDHKDKQKLSLYPIGDIHKGAAQHLDDLFKEWLHYIARTEDTSIIFTGDGCNAAIPGSKSDPFEEKMPLDKAVDELSEDLKIAEGKIDAMIAGNHDIRAYKLTSLDPMKYVAANLGVKAYDQTSMLLNYLVGDQMYTVYLRHGTGSPASLGAQVNHMIKSRETIQADLYITGHTHKSCAFPLDIFIPQGDKVVRKKQFFVSSGSFVGIERYAIERGYSPTHPGCPRIYFSGTRHDMHVSL